MTYYELTDEVMELYGEDLLLEMVNENTEDSRVSIDQVIKYDVLNKEIYGSVTVDGKTKYYHVEDGNNNGTVFHHFSDEEVDIPKTRTVIVAKIVPEVETPLSLAKAKAMQPELDEMARSINYDAYVTGGSDRTNEYWKDKVKSIKGKIVYEDIEVDL